jgi:hypothetical protein
MTKDEAWKLAEHWIAAWNAHDLDLILTHYEDAIELTSPVAAQLLGIPTGKVLGKTNLKAYFQRGLDADPELHFHLKDVFVGVTVVRHDACDFSTHRRVQGIIGDRKQRRALLHKSKRQAGRRPCGPVSR